LTVPEVQRLVLSLALPHVVMPERALAWSYWRRRHQERAKACHYRSRALRKLRL
jgi:hypothetical protein